MKVLITGGTGLIGKALTDYLMQLGNEVTILTRSQKESSVKGLSYSVWDLHEQTIDEKAVTKADAIIHLAGAGIADKKWTSKRKKELIDSRVEGLSLIYKVLKEEPKHKVKALISASGIGYYGAVTQNKTFDENTPQGDDFLAKICDLWEKEAFKFNALGIRAVCLRTGVVFAKNNSALQKMSKPIQIGIGSPLGSGNQVLPFIHIDDLCKIYGLALEDKKIKGLCNAITGNVTNKDLTKAIADILQKPLFFPNVPSFVLKLIFGEMATILLEGTQIDNTKILKAGFEPEFDNLSKCLLDCFDN